MPTASGPTPSCARCKHINPAIYVPMQGPSELGRQRELLSGTGPGTCTGSRCPTLVMGAEHDTMDPAHLRWMAEQLPRGRYHHSPNGSHLALDDDQETWFEGLLGFLRDLDPAESLSP